jgi:trk system potassium uptake protein
VRQFAVIGLSRFGTKVALTLAEHKVPIIAIDLDRKKVDFISKYVDAALQLDATDQKALAQAGVGSVDVAVVSLGEHIESSVLTTIILKEMGISEIIVKGNSKEHKDILSLVGATQVVFPEEEVAIKMAQRIISPNVLDLIPLMPGYSIVELMPPKEFYGRTLLDLNLRRNFGVEVLVIRKGDKARVIPAAMDMIEHGETLLVLGKDDDIERLRTMP